MRILLSESFAPLLNRRERYLVLCGGGGSGKSEFAARKIFYRCQSEGHHRFLVMRKVRRTLAGSVILVFLSVLAENGIEYEYNKSDRIITFTTPYGPCELLFEGMDDPEKIKSIKGITGVWLEETTEFTRSEFLQIDLRLREVGPSYHQIILSFNPDEAAGPWLKEMFFDKKDPAAFVHISTVDDNPIAELRDAYRARLDALKEKDEPFYKIYRLGMWAAQRGRIFDWDVVALPTDHGFDEVWYGADFGYSVDPTAVVRIYRRADEIWLEEILYRTGLTNQALCVELEALDVDKATVIYFDSAEPKSIDEIRNAGFTAMPCEKGADSVRSSIDFLKSKTIHIVDGSTNLIREATRYHWREDKNERVLPEPVKFDDHLIDAARYGVTTHLRQAGFLGVVEHSVYPDN